MNRCECIGKTLAACGFLGGGSLSALQAPGEAAAKGPALGNVVIDKAVPGKPTGRG
jgi:hypothetical protein